MASNFSNRSTASLSGMNLNLEPLDSLILKGIQAKIQNLTEARTVWTSSTDRALTLQQLFGHPGANTSDITITYPYVFLTITSVTESEVRLHNRTTALRGFPSVIVDDQKRAYNVKFLAVDTAVNVQFGSNSYKQIQRMASLWMFARKNGWLKFDVQYGRTQFGIGVEMDNNVTMPVREADPEDVSEYILDANLTIQGFISLPTLIEQQVANQVEHTFDLPDGTTFWSFTSPLDTSATTNTDVEPQQL